MREREEVHSGINYNMMNYMMIITVDTALGAEADGKQERRGQKVKD